MNYGERNNGIYTTAQIGGWHETLANESMAIGETYWYNPNRFQRISLKIKYNLIHV